MTILYRRLLICLISYGLLLTACSPGRAQPDFDFSKITLVPTLTEPTPPRYTFGLILDGPYNDDGWNQAHYLAGTYVEAKLSDTKMLYVDRPGLDPSLAAQELAAQGARLIVFTSEKMAESALEFARTHPGIYVILIAGDQAWPSGQNYAALPNLSNIAGRMEYGQMMAGCAAALTTQAGAIGYLGILSSHEGRRLAASAFLGARHCWQGYRGQDLTRLNFTVAAANNPVQTANDMFANGSDVLIAGIRSQDVIVTAQAKATSGQKIWVLPYLSIHACETAVQTCLGVPYFNWGPAYVTAVKSAMDNNWQPFFRWNGPDWADVNESDTSAIGFFRGPALSQEANAGLDRLVEELAFGLNLWTGPLNLLDGTPYLSAGQTATDEQVWYLPQLLQGMVFWP